LNRKPESIKNIRLKLFRVGDRFGRLTRCFDISLDARKNALDRVFLQQFF
jgi:hypothetical protein